MSEPSVLAKACLEQVALNNAAELEQNYNLIASERVQRELLADKLADQLITICPIMGTLRLETEEEDRWSDGQQETLVLPFAFTSAKRPPADSPQSVTGETPWEWKTTGTIQQVAGNEVQLVDAVGKLLTLEVPPTLKRQHRFKVGDKITVRYRREWRKSKDRIAHIILGVLY